jgi:hypothetical protein
VSRNLRTKAVRAKSVTAVVTRLVEEMASLKEETTEEVMGVVMDLRRRRRSFT